MKKREYKKYLLNYVWLFSFIILAGFTIPKAKNLTVWMIGDSTMCQYPDARSPLTGWGMPFQNYFDSTVTIKNKAKGGRSTRTFISEKRWENIVDSLHAGDYVLIQFGHNDEAKDYPDRYTPPGDFRDNLIKFITESKRKKATPVLITPVSRRYFNKSGKIKETHKPYSDIVRNLGQKYKVPVIDLDEMSRQLFQKYGPKNSKLLFMQLEKGENPHYPDGIHDNTHFNAFGARHIAELVLKGLEELNIELSHRISSK